MANIDKIETYASAAGNHEIARISVTDDERVAGSLQLDKLDLAKKLFAEYGYIRIENLFTVEQMGAFDKQYRKKYAKLLSETNKKDKRPLFTVRIEGAFSDPNLLSNPLIGPLLSHFLGKNFILAALSAVASFPGAPDQHLHRDATQLFGTDNELDMDLPPYSMTMLVPLIDFTTETGCTRVWPGSHHLAGREEGLKVGSLDPEVHVGSVLLTDGRILHRGAANRSDRLRPMFYMTFHRSWYRDFWGYEKRPPIIMSDTEFRRLPIETQRRVAWFRNSYAGVTRKYWVRSVLPPALRVRIFKDI